MPISWRRPSEGCLPHEEPGCGVAWGRTHSDHPGCRLSALRNLWARPLKHSPHLGTRVRKRPGLSETEQEQVDPRPPPRSPPRVTPPAPLLSTPRWRQHGHQTASCLCHLLFIGCRELHSQGDQTPQEQHYREEGGGREGGRERQAAEGRGARSLPCGPQGPGTCGEARGSAPPTSRGSEAPGGPGGPEVAQQGVFFWPRGQPRLACVPWEGGAVVSRSWGACPSQQLAGVGAGMGWRSQHLGPRPEALPGPLSTLIPSQKEKRKRKSRKQRRTNAPS